MKNSSARAYLPLAFIICAIIGVSVWFIAGGTSGASTSGLGTVIRQDLIQRVTIAGSIEPVRKTLMTAPYNGYVKKLFVKVGDKVKQGDPIVSVVQSLQSGDNSFPLRCPLDGTVVQIARSEGEFVKEGDAKEFILRIDDTSKLYVLANAPEIDRVKVKANQEAVIMASAVNDRKYKGIIRELSLAAREKDQWARSQVVEFPLKIEVLDADEKLKPGMTAVIDIIAGRKDKVLTLRHEFVHIEKEQHYVMTEDGKRKDIKVGIQNEEGFEILEGLTEGEKVKQVDFAELAE